EGEERGAVRGALEVRARLPGAEVPDAGRHALHDGGLRPRGAGGVEQDAARPGEEPPRRVPGDEQGDTQGRAREAALPEPRRPDDSGAEEVERGGALDPAYVRCFFFSAAGNSTLFRIRR